MFLLVTKKYLIIMNIKHADRRCHQRCFQTINYSRYFSRVQNLKRIMHMSHVKTRHLQKLILQVLLAAVINALEVDENLNNLHISSQPRQAIYKTNECMNSAFWGPHSLYSSHIIYHQFKLFIRLYKTSMKIFVSIKPECLLWVWKYQNVNFRQQVIKLINSLWVAIKYKRIFQSYQNLNFTVNRDGSSQQDFT